MDDKNVWICVYSTTASQAYDIFRIVFFFVFFLHVFVRAKTILLFPHINSLLFSFFHFLLQNIIRICLFIFFFTGEVYGKSDKISISGGFLLTQLILIKKMESRKERERKRERDKEKEKGRDIFLWCFLFQWRIVYIFVASLAFSVLPQLQHSTDALFIQTHDHVYSWML